jgi:hypothetical protein
MRRPLWLGPLVAGAIIGLLVVQMAIVIDSASAQESSGQAPAGDIAIAVSLSDVSVFTGERFTFTSEIANRGASPTPPFIASLNFTSLDQSTYVDPEDWSPQRTLTVAPIEPGSSTSLTWTINPILEGQIAAYVVVLPDSPGLITSPLISSPAIRLRVGAHKSLNPGGVLPVVIAVPAALGVAFAGLRVTSSRRRS